jgi:hypothetical protein
LSCGQTGGRPVVIGKVGIVTTEMPSPAVDGVLDPPVVLVPAEPAPPAPDVPAVAPPVAVPVVVPAAVPPVVVALPVADALAGGMLFVPVAPAVPVTPDPVAPADPEPVEPLDPLAVVGSSGMVGTELSVRPPPPPPPPPVAVGWIGRIGIGEIAVVVPVPAALVDPADPAVVPAPAAPEAAPVDGMGVRVNTGIGRPFPTEAPVAAAPDIEPSELPAVAPEPAA